MMNEAVVIAANRNDEVVARALIAIKESYWNDNLAMTAGTNALDSAYRQYQLNLLENHRIDAKTIVAKFRALISSSN